MSRRASTARNSPRASSTSGPPTNRPMDDIPRENDADPGPAPTRARGRGRNRRQPISSTISEIEAEMQALAAKLKALRTPGLARPPPSHKRSVETNDYNVCPAKRFWTLIAHLSYENTF